MGGKVNDKNYPYSHLYKSDKGGYHTQQSSGLLSAQFQYLTPFQYQNIQANIGVDSERIRHAIQNRLIHDMIFLPRIWRKKDAAHIPMIDKNGEQYLFGKDQKVKPPSFYFNLFSNPNLFY